MKTKLKWFIMLGVFVLGIVALSAVYGIVIDDKESLELLNQPSKPTDSIVTEDSDANIDETEGISSENTSTELPEIEAPDFVVYDGEDNKVSLTDLRGKPTVVNFWATWCGFCVQEMPDFNDLYKEYGEDVNFMMLNATDGVQETKEMAEEFIQEHGFEFDVYYDLDQDAAYTYGISSLPITFFIDEQGMVSYAQRGMMDEETIRGAIEDMLE